jgi:hypothetical protein
MMLQCVEGDKLTNLRIIRTLQLVSWRPARLHVIPYNLIVVQINMLERSDP